LGECRVVWSAAAADRWREVYSDLSAGHPGLLGAVLGRAEAQTIRLALLYALADCSIEIQSAHLDAALAVWSYCEASCRYIFGDALGDPLADQILAMLRRAGEEGMSRNAIREAFARHRGSDDLGRALGVLEENGLARSQQEETGGRPAERWFVAAKAYSVSAISAISAVSPAPSQTLSALSALTARPSGAQEADDRDIVEKAEMIGLARQKAGPAVDVEIEAPEPGSDLDEPWPGDVYRHLGRDYRVGDTLPDGRVLRSIE